MSTPIEMRKYLAYMRNGTPITKKTKVEEDKKKDMTMRDMLGKMRVLNEANEIETLVEPKNGVDEPNFVDNPDQKGMSLGSKDATNQATSIDQADEENKLRNYYYDNNVTFEFKKLEIYPTGVIFGGTIDGQIQFIYKVTHDEKSSGIVVDYLNDFDAQDPENEIVIKKLEDYYNVFYKYWRDQLFDQ